MAVPAEQMRWPSQNEETQVRWKSCLQQTAAAGAKRRNAGAPDPLLSSGAPISVGASHTIDKRKGGIEVRCPIPLFINSCLTLEKTLSPDYPLIVLVLNDCDDLGPYSRLSVEIIAAGEIKESAGCFLYLHI